MKNQDLVNAWNKLEIALDSTREYTVQSSTPLYRVQMTPTKLSVQQLRPQSAVSNRQPRKIRPLTGHRMSLEDLRSNSVKNSPSKPLSSRTRAHSPALSSEKKAKITKAPVSLDSPMFTPRPTSSATQFNTHRPILSASSTKRPLSAKFNIFTTMNTFPSMPSTHRALQTPSSTTFRAFSIVRYDASNPSQIIHTVSVHDLTRLFEAKTLDNNYENTKLQQLPIFIEKFRISAKKRTLKLEDQSFGPKSGAILAEILANNSHFTRIHLAKNFLGDAGAFAFSEVLRLNNTLIELDLSSNNISHAGAILLFNALESNQTLISLKLHSDEGLNRNKLDSRGCQPLATLLKKNLSLQFLSLKGTCIDSVGVQFISSGLENNETLSYLDLSNNQIGLSLCSSFVHCLPICALMELNIARNCIGNKGIAELASVFCTTIKICTLQKLDISENDISWPGLAPLLESLLKNEHLTTLIVDDNYLPGRGCLCLANFLWENVTLRNLSMKNCRMEYEAAAAFANGLERNKTLRSLSLSKNYIKCQGAQILAEAFCVKSCGIKEFDFQSCGIGEKGGLALAKAIRTNTHIEKVNLRCNNLFNSSGAALVEAARENKNLRKLLVEKNPLSLKFSDEANLVIENNVNAFVRDRASVYEKKIATLKEFELEKYKVAEEQVVLKDKEKQARKEVEYEKAYFTKEIEQERAKYAELEARLMELDEELMQMDEKKRELENMITIAEREARSAVNALGDQLAATARGNVEMENEIRRLRDTAKAEKFNLLYRKEKLQLELPEQIKLTKTLESSVAHIEREVAKMTLFLERKLLEELTSTPRTPRTPRIKGSEGNSPVKTMSRGSSFKNLVAETPKSNRSSSGSIKPKSSMFSIVPRKSTMTTSKKSKA